LDGLTRMMPAPRSHARRAPPRHEGPEAPQLGDAHILMITVDALRADRLAAMPRLHALGGVRFERAYAQAPSTAFSIRSLLTGTPPDQANGARTLAEILRARGWLTQAFYPAGLF